MNRLYLILIITLIISSCEERSKCEKLSNLTILHLNGSCYQQGLAHGTFLKKEINDIVNRWKYEVELVFNSDFESVINRFYNSTTYIDTINKYCPSILEEVRGISEGTGISFMTMLAFQMSEEIDVFSNDNVLKHCTSIGIAETDSTDGFLAQNMDPPLFLHGNPVLLHITEEKTNLESFIYTFPGFIGLTGINSSSIAITCLSISMLNHSSTGLPVSFILRSLLRKTNETDATNFIKEVPIAIPQCFLIGSRTGVKCFECSANQKTEFYPFEEKEICLHTNFSITNRDFNERFITLLKKYGKTFYASGAGFGHGVGLCQFGAKQLALMGYNYKQILNHYFPKMALKKIY